MPENIELEKILFLDIETVSSVADWNALDELGKELWEKKSKFWLKEKSEPTVDDFAETYKNKAAIYAEFGKIIVISAGFISRSSVGMQIRIKSYIGETEKQLLEEFGKMLDRHYQIPGVYGICGHNIKEFDIPFICRRMLIHGIKLPKMLQVSGKKPWETKYLIDTLELWKFGDFKNFTSLNLLAYTLGIPSPKDDIDGSQVGQVYYKDGALDRIQAYCEKDVLTVAQVYLRMKFMPLIQSDQVEIINH
jgi:predicted PolB exonuclease-like 3'-5' exonuclease